MFAWYAAFFYNNVQRVRLNCWVKFLSCISDGKACTIKRKSAGAGDAAEETPAEGATPEKKAKLSTDAESNGKAEVKA